ncbi:MAG TPA: HAD family phosphatase [Nitrospira sp.]|nr:HAD family phosphatase [Nitrospira sp.]
MLRVIIFDFNGVIADDETPHVHCFCQALDEFGLSLSKEDYYGRYLGMDERTCTALLLSARDGHSDERVMRQVQERKAELFRLHTAAHQPALFPGVVEFVKAAKRQARLAIASGGRREQIDRALDQTPIQHDFELTVSAEDCSTGKPDPAIYRMTLTRLNGLASRRSFLRPTECLVIEDSKAGIRAARAAGMFVLGLATTYPADHLHEADLVLPSLAGADPEDLLTRTW